MKKRLALTLFMFIFIVNTMSIAIAETKTTYYVVYNGKRTPILATKQSNIMLFGEEIAKVIGCKIIKEKTPLYDFYNRNKIVGYDYYLKIKKDNKEIGFDDGYRVYSLNGVRKNIPQDAYSILVNGKFFIPLSVLQNELGYNFEIKGRDVYVTKLKIPNIAKDTENNFNSIQLTGNPIYDYYLKKPIFDIGKKKLVMMKLLPKLGTPQPGNDKLDLKTGWVMPYLDKFATDNWEQDAETLRSSLEMHYFAPAVDKSIAYSCAGIDQGWEVLQLNYSEEYKTYGMWYRYPYKMDNIFEGEYHAKQNFIEPQILRFYFPTKWELLWDNIVQNNAGGMLQRGVIYQLDGREFLASSGLPVLHWTKKGGKIDRKLFKDELRRGYNGKTVLVK